MAPARIVNQQFENLPAGLRLEPGRITVEFDHPQQALEKLLALAMAIGNDLAALSAPTISKNRRGGISPCRYRCHATLGRRPLQSVRRHQLPVSTSAAGIFGSIKPGPGFCGFRRRKDHDPIPQGPVYLSDPGQEWEIAI